MLTDPGDLIIDPFAGSCVTGEVCEQMDRRWICCEIVEAYVEGAKGRFEKVPDKAQIDYNRPVPYLIHPPNSLPIDERNVPLEQEGGRNRPVRRKKENEQE